MRRHIGDIRPNITHYRKRGKPVFNYLKQIFANYQNKKTYTRLVSLLNDGTALFSAFGQDVYMSDHVNNCIDRIATEISKMSVLSVVDGANSVKRQNDEITRLFKFKPNPLQTTKDFLACCAWLRLKDCNCFIYPQYNVMTDSQGNPFRFYTSFWPLAPTRIEIGVDDSGSIWEIHFYWRDGSDDIVPYADIAHLRWRRGKNTIIGGGNDFGMPDVRELSASITALGQILDTVPKALQSSLKINGIYHAKTVIGIDALNQARQNFEDHISSSHTGIVATDLPGEFMPVTMSQPHIDDTVMMFLKSIVRERYGISEAMMTGDYTADQHSAFYQTCLEDFATEFEQAMSACLFTQREQDVGHHLRCYLSRTEFMNTQQKIELATLGTNTGLFTFNQILDMFGYEPQPDGDRKIQSLNYASTEIVDGYQLNMAKGTKGMPKGEEKNGE